MTLNNFSSLISSFPLTYYGALDSAIYMPDDFDKRIIHLLQGDLPLTDRPFAVLAERIGIREEELLDRIKSLKEQGILRRFGASIKHQGVGFRDNAMVAWHVPEDEIANVGPLMGSFKEVSHCYQRKTQGEWKYNLFTMIHGNSKKACREIAGRIAEKTGVEDYILLFTLEEFKKTSPEYF